MYLCAFTTINNIRTSEENTYNLLWFDPLWWWNLSYNLNFRRSSQMPVKISAHISKFCKLQIPAISQTQYRHSNEQIILNKVKLKNFHKEDRLKRYFAQILDNLYHNHDFLFSFTNQYFLHLFKLHIHSHYIHTRDYHHHLWSIPNGVANGVRSRGLNGQNGIV